MTFFQLAKHYLSDDNEIAICFIETNKISRERLKNLEKKLKNASLANSVKPSW